MSVFLFVLVVSLILLAMIVAASKSPVAVCLISGGATLFFLFAGMAFFSAALILQAFLTFVAVLIALIAQLFRNPRTKLRPRSILAAASGAMVVSYVVALWIGLAALPERARLRARYPLESLASRLEYEVAAAPALPAADSLPSHSPLTPEVEARLGSLEESRQNESSRHWSRSWALGKLHDRVFDEFVVAQGFGDTRMSGVHVSEWSLDRENQPIPEEQTRLPEPAPDEPSAGTPEHPSALPSHDEKEHRISQVPRSTLLNIHDTGLTQFVNPQRMGYVRDRDHVAGFLPHRFERIPTRPEYGGATPAPWNIVRLELVSILKHQVPVAYASDRLPQMDKLKDAKTRPLDVFEQRALHLLRTDEDLVIDETESRIWMVGALRAGKDCLQCHSIQRGELLGAFTYELVPAQPAPAAKPGTTPEPSALLFFPGAKSSS